MITRRHFRRWAAWTGVAIGAVAALGYLLSFVVMIQRQTRDQVVWVGRGAITAQATQVFAPAAPAASWAVTGPGPLSWSWLPRIGPDRQVLPFWIPLVIGVTCVYILLPAGYGAGRCQRCGYDLRGAARSGTGLPRCPECGSITAVDRPASRPH